MPLATGAKAKSAASQAEQPRVFAMVVLEGEATGVDVADAETAMSFQYRVKRVYVLDVSFTDADLRACALNIQRGYFPAINAFIFTIVLSEDDWPEMSFYITEGWAMILEDEYSTVVNGIRAAINGRRAFAKRIMANCRMLP